MVVSLDRAETIRSHHDMEKDNELCRFTKKASKFYEEYAQKAVKNGHTGTMIVCPPAPWCFQPPNRLACYSVFWRRLVG